MKKVAMVFVVAVIVPSLVLAWLALRSLRDQQFLVERQQSLLYQGVTDSLAKSVTDYLSDRQTEFGAQVDGLLAHDAPAACAVAFDNLVRTNWPLAQVGFCVTTSGQFLCPAPVSVQYAGNVAAPNDAAVQQQAQTIAHDPEPIPANTESVPLPPVQEIAQQAVPSGDTNVAGQAPQSNTAIAANNRPALRQFYNDNYAFLGNRQSAQVYLKSKSDAITLNGINGFNASQTGATNTNSGTPPPSPAPIATGNQVSQVENRKVNPMQQGFSSAPNQAPGDQQAVSKISAAEGEFRQLVGDSRDGMVARFLQNKLNLMFWHRPDRYPNLIFGAQVDLPTLVQSLHALVRVDSPLDNEICLALLDDNARPVALSHSPFAAPWKHPFVATEVGEELPHWEIAAYLLHPDRLSDAARTIRLTLGLIVALLVLAIGIGSWLIVTDLNRQLRVTRQKTDFVSNVSHELKTPLTSIRMFSELLAEERVADPGKRRAYLNIITAETARLTRLINNVLDFSRMERGEKKYKFQDCNLVTIARDTAESYRPHLENNGFVLHCEFEGGDLPVRAEPDALAQVIVNLLSNAEKYSGEHKEVTVRTIRREGPLPCAEVQVLDRGGGVPAGSEEKIFEQFYRAHDALSSGVQGSGLGLTLARQIARAHGGDISYQARDGGGSCFYLRLPLAPDQNRQS